MDPHWAYCSACDRQVQVVVRPGARVDTETGARSDEVLCLAFGESCTGALCPLSDLPTEQMRETFDRQGGEPPQVED